MKLALCQMQPNDRMQENLEQSLQCIREAARNGADLILFPEVQLTPFFPQYPGQDASVHCSAYAGSAQSWLSRICICSNKGTATMPAF